jgi:hypothetical protein
MDLSGNELLPAVDVIRRTSKCRVAHDVNRQRRAREESTYPPKRDLTHFFRD